MRVYHEKKSNKLRGDNDKKTDRVRVQHEKKSDGGDLTMRKERWGESSL